MSDTKKHFRGLLGLVIAGTLFAAALLIRGCDQRQPSGDNHSAGHVTEASERTALALPAAAAPDDGTAKEEAFEPVRNEMDALEKALKSAEKARSKVISKVDNAAVSHVRFLIPIPTDQEILNVRQKIIDLSRRLEVAGFSPEERTAEVRRLEDYIDFGSTKLTARAYRNRVLNVDIRHDDDDRMVATLDSAGDVEYGTQEGAGVPWYRTSGATMTRRLDNNKVNSRYGHLFLVKDSP